MEALSKGTVSPELDSSIEISNTDDKAGVKRL